LQNRTAIGMAGRQNRCFRLNFCGAISILWLYPQEALMRGIALIAAVAVTMLPLAGFAQQGTVPSASTVGVAPAGSPGPDVVPEPGGPLNPGSQTGRDVVASDGISTKTVKAVPCSTVARETDGTTTCIGIPDAPQRRR
jgi:hypothetical protein